MTEIIEGQAPQGTDDEHAAACRRRTRQACPRGPRGEVVGAVEGRGHLRLRPHPAARERLLDRHPAADRQRQPARGPRLLLHPHRPGGAVPADARQGRLLPDGLGRQRAADRAPRPELLRRPVRPVAAVRRRLHPAGEAGPQEAGADQPAQLHRALRAARARGRAEVRGAVAHARALGRLGPHYTTIGQGRPEGQPDRVPAQLRPRRGLPAGGAHPLGRHVPDRRRPGRARGTRVRRRLPPRRLPPRRRRPRPTSRPRGPS